jgi:hypothetical protein
VHFSFKALMLRVQSTRNISALFPIFASGAGVARATRKNGMLPGFILNGSEFLFLKLIHSTSPQYATSNLFSMLNQGNNLYRVLQILKCLKLMIM